MKTLHFCLLFVLFLGGWKAAFSQSTPDISLSLSCLPSESISLYYKSGSDCTVNTYETIFVDGKDGFRILFSSSRDRWEIYLLEQDNSGVVLQTILIAYSENATSPNPPSSGYIGTGNLGIACNVSSISGAISSSGSSSSGDSDGDGVPDACDVCTGDDSSGDTDGDGICNNLDICPSGADNIDSDGDGTPDACDGCPADASKTSPGACGCGVSDADTDGDGTPDCEDGCPADASKTSPGACGCGVSDADTDGDGTPDCEDDCPADASKTSPGICGCGIAESNTDADSDGKDDACDDDGFTVSKAADALSGLISAYGPKKGTRRSLNNQLGEALNACSSGDRATAIDELTGFINHVEAKRGKDFNDEEADALIEAATAIRSAIASGASDCGGGTSRQAGALSLTRPASTVSGQPVLRNNFPNPFHKQTRIDFYLPAEMNVRLRVFDLMGREIETLVNGKLPAGEHQLNWHAGHLHSGVYIYRLEADDFSQSRRMILNE